MAEIRDMSRAVDNAVCKNRESDRGPALFPLRVTQVGVARHNGDLSDCSMYWEIASITAPSSTRSSARRRPL
jgi:hypothetical protein